MSMKFLIILCTFFSSWSVLFPIEQKYQLNEIIEWKKKQWQVVNITQPKKKTYKNVNSSSHGRIIYTLQRPVISCLLNSQINLTDRVNPVTDLIKKKVVEYKSITSATDESLKPTALGYTTFFGLCAAGIFGLYKLFSSQCV